jgi:phage terminase large subunit-like protein
MFTEMGNLQHRDRPVLVEDSSAGIALTQELRLGFSSIIPVTAERDKISRMAIASARFEAGQVFLPERASWLPDLEAELSLPKILSAQGLAT